MAYNPINFQNTEAGGTPLSASNLNHLEQGIIVANELVPDSEGSTGQVLTKTENGTAWQNTQESLPSGGTVGQVLTKTETGSAWQDTDAFPEEGTVGQVLTKSATGVQWTNAGNPTDTQVATAVTAWLDENVTEIPQTAPIVDTSLTIQGAAADAKKTGDEISDLKSQIAQGSGLTADIKQALMNLANAVAFKGDDPTGQTVIDSLEDALYSVTAITLNSNSLSFGSLGATQQLTATTTPEGGNVTWSSSDTSVATVDQTGLVTSVAYGNATITATSGSVSATCSVVIATATVTSLSAVYSPSGNVYEGASLDSLKSDLTVTANWSNGTTTTVSGSDYSLSGTLAVGSNTITVAYGSQTTTFNVTVSAIPEYGTFTPDNYVQGYYIETDGTVTASQYGSMSETYYDVARGVLNFACNVNFRVSTYNANKEFLKQVIYNSDVSTANAGNGTLKSRNAAITFTDDVKYFRLSWSSTSNVEFTITNVEYTDLHMEIGDIDTTTGDDIVQPLRIRSVDYIPVSSTSLVLNNFKPFLDAVIESYGFLGRCYDSSKTLIGNIPWTTRNSTITLPTGTAFIRPIIQLHSTTDIPDDFADYVWIPLILNSANYRIVKA